MQKGITIEIQRVCIASKLEVQVDEDIVVTRNYTIHQCCHQSVILGFDEALLLHINEIDGCFDVSGKNRDMKRCLSTVIWITDICTEMLNQSTHRLDLAIVSSTMQESQTLVIIYEHLRINSASDFLSIEPCESWQERTLHGLDCRVNHFCCVFA